MPYALSYLVHGRKPSWRYISSAEDLAAGETYREADPPPGWVWDSGTQALRAPTTAEAAENARIERMNAAGAEDWIAPTLLSGWVNFGAPYAGAGYYRDAQHVVYLRGVLKNGTAVSPFFVLPAGYRPSADVMLSTHSNNRAARVDVEASTGRVEHRLGGAGFFTLDGLSFRAA